MYRTIVATIVCLSAVLAAGPALSQGPSLTPPAGSSLEEGRLEISWQRAPTSRTVRVFDQTTASPVSSVGAWERCKPASPPCVADVSWTLEPGHSYQVTVAGVPYVYHAKGELRLAEKRKLVYHRRLLVLAARRLRVAKIGECEPKDSFKLFTGGSARRVSFKNAFGRAEAVFLCGSDSVVWITLYPPEPPGLRYRVFSVEAELEVQIQENEEWELGCSMSRCDRVRMHPDNADSWEASFERVGRLRGLGRFVSKTLDAYENRLKKEIEPKE